MTRGCLIGVVFVGVLIAAYYVALTPYFEWPGNAVAAVLGGMFAALFLSGIYGLFRASRDAARLSGTRAVGTFTDGETVAVAGTIRPINAPIEAPFSGTPCVAYDYDITHIASRSSTSGTDMNEAPDISGLALTPSIIETPTGGVRLLSFAMLDQFPQQLQSGVNARTRATDFIAKTTFKPMGVTKLFTAMGVLKEALTDEDGAVRVDLRMNPDDIDLDTATIHERLVTVGQQVSAVGKYSAARRGLLAEGMTTLIQLRPGDAESARRAVWSKAWSALGLGTLCFVVSHGILGAMLYMSETRYQRVSADQQEMVLRDAVQSKDPAKIQQVVARGVNPNVRGARNATLLHDARDAETVRTLIKAGADPNLIDDYGYTPLMMAARSGSGEVVAALLAGSAQVNLARKDGGTALGEAIENQHDDIAATLRAHGATTDLLSAENGKPLPADGGEPMQIVRAYLAGVHARDVKAMTAAFIPVKPGYFDGTDFDLWHRIRPQAPVLLSGFTNGTAATLAIGGPTIANWPITWHYQLVYKGEVWHIAREWDTDSRRH